MPEPVSRPEPSRPELSRAELSRQVEAAEARAATAAADAKAAIALAARAAAAADAAAQAAEEAAARLAREVGGPADAGRDLAERPGPVRHGRPDPLGGADLLGLSGVLGTADATQPVTLPTPGGPVPAPRPATGRRARRDGGDAAHHGGDAVHHTSEPHSAARPITTARAQASEPVTALLPALPADDPAPSGRRAARRAAEESADRGTHAAPAGPAEPDDRPAPRSDAPRSRPAGTSAADRDDDPAPRRRRRAADTDAENTEDDGAEAPTRATRRARAAAGGTGRRLAAPRRRLRPPVLVAAAAGGVLVLGGVAFGTGVIGTPQPAAVSDNTAVPALPNAAADSDPDDGAADGGAAGGGGTADGATLSNQAVEYLRELREAGVPTSRAGTAEVEAADLVCEELADGMDPEKLARALPASLPTVSRSQAADLVDVAQEFYCE